MMNVITIVSNVEKSNCYLIEDNDGYIIIDPSLPVKRLIKYPIKAVLLTHGHYDHIYYLDEVVKKYNPIIYCHKKCIEKIFNDNYNLSSYLGHGLNIDIDKTYFQEIKDNQIIKFQSFILKILYSPGHTSDSICFIDEENHNFFSGDTLFYRSIGRTDFYSGNALEMVESLNKIIHLNNDYIIYPGHGVSTTLSNEIKHNNYIKVYCKNCL